MEVDSYKVDVIHYLNPYLIWIEVLEPSRSSSAKNDFEQIGLFGILPVEHDSDMVEQSEKVHIAKDWNEAAREIMHEAFRDAKEIWFTLTYIDRRSSLFSSKIHKYGDILMVSNDGTMKKLSRILRKENLGIRKETEFCKRLIIGNLKTKLDDVQTSNVIRALETNIKKKQTYNNLMPNSIQSHTSLFQAIQVVDHLKSLLTEKNLQIHNKQMKLYEHNIAGKAENLMSSPKDIGYLLSMGRGSTRRPLPQMIGKTGPKTTVLEQIKNYTSKMNTEPKYTNEDVNNSKLFNVVDRDTPIAANNVTDEDNSGKTLYFERTTPTCHEAFQSRSVDKIHSSNSIERKVVSSNKDTKKVSSHLRTKMLPDYDKKTEKLVICGPPEVKFTDLVPKVVSKSAPMRKPVSYVHQAKNENELKQDNVWSGIDSEVNYPIDSSKRLKYIIDKIEKYSVKPKNIVTKDNLNSSTEPKPLNISSPNAINLSSPEKILQYNKISHANFNISTVNDTSTKAIIAPELEVGNQNSEDFDETLSELIENTGLNNQTPTFIKKEEITVPPVYHINPFKNVDVTTSTFVEKLVNPILMVHGTANIRIQPRLDLRDVCFTPEIHATLNKLLIKRPMMVQTISWPTILMNYSLFMIGPVASGKTLGYLPAVCRFVSDKHNQEFNLSHGPYCIIVCATAKSVMNVSKLCKRLLNSSRVVLSCFAGLDEQEFLIRLLNGCDILVSTPCALSRLLINPNLGLDLKRLSIFVMDDCERLNDVYVDETKLILLKIKDLTQKRTIMEGKVQFILASRIWCDFMRPLAKRVPNCVICIGAYQECVLYSKAPTSIDFLQRNHKVDAVLQFLKTLDVTTKTVIVCQRDEEIEILVKKLEEEKYVVFAADSSMTVEILYRLNKNWMEYNDPVVGPVLVCCDSNLTHLNITDSHNLLHYSLPNLFSTFCRRFAVLTDRYLSIFKDNQSEENTVRIKIFVEEENIEQLPKIVHFISRCSDDLPQKLKDLSNEVTIEKDLRKAKILTPLCDFLLSFSECPDFWNCTSRHTIFKNYDEPPNWMPKSGIVTFNIIHFHNAILYSAQLKSHIQNGQVHTFPQISKLLEAKLSLYFSNYNNRRPHGIPSVGDMCVVTLKINHYQRCQIIKILHLNDRGNPEKVLIKLIDQEKWDTANEAQLYHLPEKFKTMPSNIVQIRLANIQPKDKDITFSYIADQHVQTLINEDNQYLRGKVLLSVGTSLIIDNLEVCQDLSSVKETVVRYNIKKELMRAHALPKEDHVTKLQEILKESGLFSQQISEIQVVQNAIVSKELPKPSWAHLNKEDVSIVYIVYVENPSKFFVRLVKFQDCLDQLTKDIQKYIANYKNNESVASNKKGDLVLAKFPDNGSYYRARIDEIPKDDLCECFFVDHGDWRKVATYDIVPITEQFITRMPFQAIECRLIGVKPMVEEWTEFSTNWFCDNCLFKKTDDLSMMYVKYFIKENAECTGGSKYGVAMIDEVDSKYVIINKIMLGKNLAQPVENEIIYLNDLDIQKVTSKPPDSESNWEKEALQYKDNHYQRKFDVENDTNPMESLFPKTPIRSVPLVGSDNDSISSDNFDVYITKDDMDEFLCDPSGLQEQNIKSIKGKIPEVGQNDVDTLSIDSSSKTSFEMVDPPKSKSNVELDSDDLTSPETESNTSMNIKNVTLESKQSSASIPLNPILTPKLYWRQNRTTATIRIDLLGVQEYIINIGNRTIDFSTTVNNSKYAFELELYGVVKPKVCQYEAKSLYVLVKLEKLIPKLWMTLTRDDVKRNWISYEPDYIDTSSDDESDDELRKKELLKHCEKNYDESDRDTDDGFSDDNNEYDFD